MAFALALAVLSRPPRAAAPLEPCHPASTLVDQYLFQAGEYLQEGAAFLEQEAKFRARLEEERRLHATRQEQAKRVVDRLRERSSRLREQLERELAASREERAEAERIMAELKALREAYDKAVGK